MAHEDKAATAAQKDKAGDGDVGEHEGEGKGEMAGGKIGAILDGDTIVVDGVTITNGIARIVDRAAVESKTVAADVSGIYSFRRGSIEPAVWAECVKQLTWTPTVGDGPGLRRPAPPTLRLYTETTDFCSVPAAFGLGRLGPATRDLRWSGSAGIRETDGAQIPAERAVFANRISRPTFCDAIARALAARSYGGVVTVSVGCGRIILALEHICRSRNRAILLSQSQALLGPCAEEARLSCPALRTAVIRSGRDLRNKERMEAAAACDLLLMRTDAVKDCPVAIAARFGTVFVDEIESISPIKLAALCCGAWRPRRWIGLSYGQARMDGGEAVARLLFGEPLFDYDAFVGAQAEAAKARPAPPPSLLASCA